MKNNKRFNILLSMLLLSFAISITFAYLNNENRVAEFIDDDEIPLGGFLQLDSTSNNTIDRIKVLEDRFREILPEGTVKQINNGVMSIIRRNKYGYNSEGANSILWERYAGSMNEEIGLSVPHVENVLADVLNQVDGKLELNDPVSSAEIDFLHMIAVIDINYSDAGTDSYKEECYKYLLTWGGDLETFLIDMDRNAKKESYNSYDDYYEYAINTLGISSETYFSESDFLADLDGVNIAEIMISDELLLSEALLKYYLDGDVSKRKEKFVDHFGGESEFLLSVKQFMFNGEGSKYSEDPRFNRFMIGFAALKMMMIENYVTDSIDDSVEMRRALAQAFIDRVVE